MNEQSYFHWDLFRPPIHSPSFAMGTSFLDIREEAMRGMPQKTKAFSFDQSCALWSKDIGLDPGDGLQNVGGRVLEIRKEKSRDAARSRRGKENYEFYELAKLLPLPAAITSQLDKASIIRLSISYLKLRDFCGHGDPPWPREGTSANKNIKGGQRRRNNTGLAVELFEMHQGAHILQSLDGFAFTLSNDGRFLYISETVSIYLGLSQVEMAGSSMFDYVHSQDHQELADHLGLGLASVQSTMMCPASPAVEPPNSTRSITPPINDRVPLMTPNLENGPDITFCLRMKSTLTKRGVHIRSSGYRVLQICGQFRHQMSFGLGRKGQAPMLGLTAVAIALPPPSVTELRIEADTFIMRLTTQFKIIYCENVVSSLTDWKCEDLAAKNLYTFCHPGDVCHLRKTHTDLLSKGQVMSPSLRILNKGGGFIWVQMCATSLYNSKTSDDQTVLAIFQTISSIEHRGVVMDASHLDTPINSPQSRDSNCEQENDTTPIESPLQKTDFHDTETKLTSKSEPSASICESSETLSIFPDNVENDFLLDEHAEESLKHDNKLSRRKTDRPRKRKRDSFDNAPVVENADEETCVNLETVSSVSIDNLDGNILNLSSHHTSLPNSPSIDRPSDMTSPQLPEDLSFRPIVDKHNASDCDGKDQHLVANKDDIMTSSVKELEKVMNRHLPLRSTGAYHSVDSEDMAKEFSDAQKSSIQWSGAVAVSPIANDSLAASAFLRHLYTSRESVIRSNGRPHCYNGTEVNALNMLTPPSTDVCKDQLHLNIPHIAVQSKNLFTATHKDPVSMLTSTNEEFNMTPPSSVSPQDKMASPFQDGDITSECLNMRIGQGGQGTATSAKLQQFSAIVDTNSSDILPKPSYLSVPNFQYHSLETNHFSHSLPPSGGGLYESRPPDHSMWYGSAYTS